MDAFSSTSVSVKQNAHEVTTPITEMHQLMDKMNTLKNRKYCVVHIFWGSRCPLLPPSLPPYRLLIVQARGPARISREASVRPRPTVLHGLLAQCGAGVSPRRPRPADHHTTTKQADRDLPAGHHHHPAQSEHAGSARRQVRDGPGTHSEALHII